MAGPLQLRDLRKDARMLIAPSLLSADVLNMGSHIDSLCGEADWLHIDIMDGHFVPNLSYGPSLVKALRKTYPGFFLDVHIMVEPAEAFIDMFLAEKPSLLTVHIEAAKHIHRALQKISAAGCAAGVALDPGTPVEALCPVLQMTDLVLVMSVNPGYGGQSFIPETLSKLDKLVQWREENGGHYLIEIDGGVSRKNIAEIARHGCDVAVAGSAVFGQPDPRDVVTEMKRLSERSL